MRYLAILIFAGAAWPAGFVAASQTKTEQSSASPERIEALINRLGSNKHADRVQATKDLETIGPAALPQLRLAMKSADAEIKNRAGSLVRKIEDQQTTAFLLAPKRLRLKLKDASVAEAVAELAKQSGFPIEWTGDSSPFADRKITIDTGDTTFWDALKKLTDAAGVVEVGNALIEEGKTAELDARARELAAMRDRMLQLQKVLGESLNGQIAIPTDATVRLAAGKTTATPDCINGSVRIKAVNVTAPEKGAIDLLLEVKGEARLMGFSPVGDARIDIARDDKGQFLQPLQKAQENDNFKPPSIAGNVFAVNGMKNVGDGNSARLVNVRLQLGEKPGRILKELTGKIMVETTIDAAPQIVIDKVLNAAGKSAKSKQGASLAVQSVAPHADGEVHIEVVVDSPPEGDEAIGAALAMLRRVQAIQINGNNGKKIIGGGIWPDPPDKTKTPHLVDAVGKQFSLVEATTVSASTINGQVSNTMRLVYRPSEGQGPPAQLILPGRRQFVMEVPFTLREIVLP